MRGRPKKPTRLKIIQGTFRGDRAPQNEPKPDPLTKVPAPPRHLQADAKKLWRRLAPELTAQGILTDLDLPALEVCCFGYGLYRELLRAIRRRHKSVAAYLRGRNSQTTPEIAVMKAAMAIFKSFASEFGIMPSARARLDLPEPKPKGKDPMEELLNAP